MGNSDSKKDKADNLKGIATLLIILVAGLFLAWHFIRGLLGFFNWI